MNVMVRGSILYASEMYYNLKETELRQIERIEEGFLRQVFKTTKGCPLTQLYLSIGEKPARFEIQKRRLLFMKKILHEDDESLINKFFKLQLKSPSRGDWASLCLKDLKELRISESMEEIKLMPQSQFKKLVKTRVTENAFNYLIKKQGSKGKENKCEDLSMAEYLHPTNKAISISDKQQLFAMKNRMTNIPANFPKPNIKPKCFCNEDEDMAHIYNCVVLNNGKTTEIEYEKIYNGTLSEQIVILRIFEKNIERREQLMNEKQSEDKLPRDPFVIHCSKLSTVMD